MLPYWLLFVLWAAGAVQAERRPDQRFQLIFFVVACVVTTLMIGLRFQVGGDWGAYQNMYEEIYFLSLKGSIGTTDPGYAALNWLASQVGLDVTFVNLVCATIFMVGVSRLALRQPNPALAILVAVPYLIIVVAMGYTRQASAIGFICLAIADASEKNVARLVILVGLAALFHKTAVLILPILLIPILRRNIIIGVFGGLVFVLLFVLLLRDSSETMVGSYIQGSYDSQGATIRVAMTVIPGILFLLLRNKIAMPAFQKSFWIASSIISVVFVGALAIASASSGIDRMSLYFIPLQFVVYSRLPYVLGRDGKALPSVLISVLLYCFLVQYVWLNYADNSGYWVPYTTVLAER